MRFDTNPPHLPHSFDDLGGELRSPNPIATINISLFLLVGHVEGNLSDLICSIL